MSMLQTFARLVGLSARDEVAADALKSERAARATLSRRGFLLSTATLATGSAMVELRPVLSAVLYADTDGFITVGVGSGLDEVAALKRAVEKYMRMMLTYGKSFDSDGSVVAFWKASGSLIPELKVPR